MEIIEYKDLSKKDFIEILLRFMNEASDCTKILTEDKENGKHQLHIKEIAERYAKMKDELKNIYEYSQKRVNQIWSADYNTFMGAIRDMYVNLKARRNTKNYGELFASIYEIEFSARSGLSDLNYHE